MQGIVFDIKRFAVHDGPGIRTTVHMKGCPLKCIWCHNPEGIELQPVTKKQKIMLGDKEFFQNETVGKLYSSEALLRELLRDQLFWEESNGGVTFSGGEPLMQYSFLLEMVKKLKAKNIHVTIDTCGLIEPSKLDEIASLVDLFLFDLKILNNKLHKAYTGVDNQLILNNLDHLLANKCNVRVRIPVIPEKNFNNNALHDYLVYLKEKQVAIDLLPFHSIANSKYERFEMTNEMKGISSLTKDDLVDWKQEFMSAGFNVTVGG